MLPTADQLRALFPHARDGYITALSGNSRLLTEHGLDQPLPLCHFLAQAAHETGDFTIVEESGNYSAERLRAIFPTHFTPGQAAAYAHKPQAVLSRAYGGRMGNGGEAGGDGWRYRGRSFFQTTGKYNYCATGERVGVDLVAQPELLATDFSLGLKAALLEWSALDLGGVASRLGATHEAVLRIAKGINCGSINSSVQPNGLAERKSLFLKIWRALGGDAAPALDPAADGVLEEGEAGHLVARLQVALASRGFSVGKIDGIYGPRTTAAVASLQARERLGGEPGKFRLEWSAGLVDARPFDDVARQDDTAATLAANGNKAVAATGALKTSAGIVAALASIGQANESVQAVRQAVDPAVNNLQWALGMLGNKWAWAIMAALAVVAAASWIEAQIVARHREFRP
jgi:putative chitinase